MGAAVTVVALALAGVLGDPPIPPPALFPSPPAPGVANAAFGASISRATSSKHSPSSFADASRPVPRVAAFQILLNAPSLNPLGRKNATACSPRIVPCPLALARVQCALSASASRIVARKLSGVQRSDDIRAATNASRVASRARVRVARGARRAREGVFFRSRDPRSNSDARSIVTTDARRSVDCRAMQREPRRATAATTTVDRRSAAAADAATRWDRGAARRAGIVGCDTKSTTTGWARRRRRGENGPDARARRRRRRRAREVARNQRRRREGRNRRPSRRRARETRTHTVRRVCAREGRR